MLRNQSGVGGVGTYWVTLVAGGLVESESGALTTRGVALGDAFLSHNATPDREYLRRVVAGEDFSFEDSALVGWGRSSHLGAASGRERRLLADALLQPDAHRQMATAARATNAAKSDAHSFRLLATYLRKQHDHLASELAAVLAVALKFEGLHRELLYRFDQVLATSSHGTAYWKSLTFMGKPEALVRRADALRNALTTHQGRLPRPVASAVQDFSLAVDHVARSRSAKELAINLIRHHERVQAGRLDASRQPKLPWAEVNGSGVAVAPRYALETRPSSPDSNQMTHPYRIEQFAGMLQEVGVWEPTP